MVESHGKHGVKVMWKLPKQPDPEYQLILYVVNVVGTKFTSETNSDIRFVNGETFYKFFFNFSF